MTTDFMQEPKIVSWKKMLSDSGCTIKSIEQQNLYHRSNGELLFAFLKAYVTSQDGDQLPPVIFIRGHACIIVPLVTNKSSGEKRFLMVVQRRIASGAPSLEFPAGMLDRDIDNPKGIALKELTEETGIIIPDESLFPLTNKLLFTSPGACDEGIYYFGCFIELEEKEFNSLNGRLRGQESEYEHISVILKTKEEAEKEITSLPALLGLFLFREYCSKNNIL